MLIVLHTAPCSTPLETLLKEQAMAQVATRQTVGRGFATVSVGLACNRADNGTASTGRADAGVIQGIDVHRFPHAVGREPPGTCHTPEIKARGIVGRHGTLVVGSITVDNHHALYGIMLAIQAMENAGQTLCHILMAHHFTEEYASTCITMQEPQIAKVGCTHGAAFGQTVAFHAMKNAVGEGDTSEAAVFTIGRHGSRADHTSYAPLLQVLKVAVGSSKGECAGREEREGEEKKKMKKKKQTGHNGGRGKNKKAGDKNSHRQKKVKDEGEGIMEKGRS